MRIKIGSLIIVIIFLWTGCANNVKNLSKNVTYSSLIPLKDYKSRLLVQRFIEYWDARVNQNMKKAWTYELPYQRYLTTFDRYQNMVGGYKGENIELLEIKYISPEKVIIKRKVINRKSGKAIIKKDKWLFIKDNWYHKFYQTALPPQDEEEVEFQ